MFTPAVVCISEGSKVTFSNTSSASADVVSRDVNASDAVDAAPAVDLTLSVAGTGDFTPADGGAFPYRERVDAAAKGVVVVIPAP
jgi:hypothetical protein